MKLYVLALLCAFAALGLATQASSSDFLDPMQLGESMSTPLPLDLVQKAKAAGIITGSTNTGDYTNEVSSTEAAQSSSSTITSGSTLNPGPVDGSAYSSAGATSGGSVNSSVPSPSAQAANASGIWSIDLKDTVDRHLDLSLFQNGDVIMGYGSMTSENETQGVTVSGSVEGSEIDLSVTTMNTLDLYKLQLTSSGEAISGSYSAYEASGKTWSGTATGAAPASTFGSASSSGENVSAGGSLGETAESAASQAAGPVDQSGQSSPSSQSTAMLGSGAGSSAAVAAGPVSGQSSSTYAGTAGSSISSSSAGSGSSSQSIQIGTGSVGSYSSMTSTSSSVMG